MPIPPIKNNSQWRNNRKKYYVARKRTGSWNKKRKINSNRGGLMNSKSKQELFEKIKKFLFVYGSLAILAGVMFVFIFISWLSRGLPNPDQLLQREIAQSTKIYDRTGEVILYEIHGDEKRTLVSLEEIPDYLEKATISIEDKNFYKHKGFSLWAMFRTLITNTLYGKKAGGSTLTQQFVKNSVLTSEKTYTRKIKELILAYKLEKKFTKDQILQMYLNEIPYGSTSYGVEAASQRYFSKSARDINLAEAAILAALPQAPSRYSPYGSNLDLLIARQEYILGLMVEQEYITEEEAQEAKDYELEFKRQSANIKAPHFVMYVKEILSEKYGEKMIEQGGLKIYTSLDLYKQNIAEEVLTELSKKNAEQYRASNAALVSIDPKSGEILAMVGSRDYFDDEIDGQVNIAVSNRQPGSSLKPLVYAASFLKGYTPNTILYDVVTNFSNDEAEPYEPHNYDSAEHGPVDIRKALAGSLNIPAVKAIYLAGIDNVLDLARDVGYSTLNDRDRFGLSLVLGGGEVKLVEHVNAYSAFAREGLVQEIRPILKIESGDGELIEEFKSQNEKKVLDSNVARMINNVLSDNNARAYAFGERNWLTLGSRPVGAKTGTTNDYRDAWTIGYTPSIVTGVWVGNNDNSEMKRGAAGGTVAAPIWHDYMKAILEDTPVEYFKDPEIAETGKGILDGESGLEKIIKIDKISGLLAGPDTPPEYIEEKTFLDPHSILYFVDKDDPLGDAPENPEKDPQFTLWEDAIKSWAEAQEFATSTPPTETDNVHIAENQPELTILSPTSNQVITTPLLVSRVDAEAKRGIARVEYYINNNLFSVNRFFPYNLEKRIQFLSNGFHNLKVRACDDVDNCTLKEVEFNLILEGNVNKDNIEGKLLSPSGGIAVTNIDFPLGLSLEVNEPDQVARINVYTVEGENEPVLVRSIQPIETKQIESSWSEIPATGSYKVYGEIVGWSGAKVKTNETVININNIN